MTEPWPHLQVLRPGPDTPVIVLIPGLLGLGIVFQPIAALSPRGSMIIAMNLPGSDRREDLLDLSIETVADVFEPQIRAIVGHRPVVFGGFSLGALIAFELGLRWQERGEPVQGLVSFDGPSPAYTSRRAPLHRKFASHWASYGRDKRHLSRLVRNAASDTLSLVGLEWLLAENLERTKQPAAALRAQMLAAKRIRAERSYTARSLFQGPLCLIRVARGEQASGLADEPDYHWGQHAKGPVRVHRLAPEVTHASYFAHDAQRAIIAAALWSFVHGLPTFSGARLALG